MKNEINIINHEKSTIELPLKNSITEHHTFTEKIAGGLFITSYPPRECGIATYSQDLIKALNNKFIRSFSFLVCALENEHSSFNYPKEVKYILNTNDSKNYIDLANKINKDPDIDFIILQHEFGFFQNIGKSIFMQFLFELTKPIIIVFHTVLPHPNESLKSTIRHIATVCETVVVMTKNSSELLSNDYQIPQNKIAVIPHGTHLVPHLNKEFLKEKYGLSGRKVLSTFGLLSSGKGIGTSLRSMPAIIKSNPDAIFLIIGKTHPGVILSEGEKYRDMLESLVEDLKLEKHVKFINQFLPLPELLEYLQLTDIYLFTSKDPNQAVSGTFSYAMSCGCPIISTPIPHAMEMLSEDTGIIIDFQNSEQLAEGVNKLMSNEQLRIAFSTNTLKRIVPTSWENSAISHALLVRKVLAEIGTTGNQGNGTKSNSSQKEKISINFRLPTINLDHLKKMTTDFGLLQFAKINQPDIESGYTLDDNARALITMIMHYELTSTEDDLKYIKIYLEFIKYCLQTRGNFLNYVDIEQKFTKQNENTNLADATGRAIWALGYLISKRLILPPRIISTAETLIFQVLSSIENIHSTRAMAFTIKGLYYLNIHKKSPRVSLYIKTLADRLLQMYRHESEPTWLWYESYLTYANSLLPEAMLYASFDSGNIIYKETAKISFDFLLSMTFNKKGINVVPNKKWLQKGQKAPSSQSGSSGGEQPIDVAYTILAIASFYKEFKEKDYLSKMVKAYNWFLGSNHLHQIIYNPCTGGCYDGLEENNVNLNQGAESTLSYLMARFTIEKQNSFRPI